MNRDPFDWLRSRNPVPPESLPDAPMTVASAITSGRPSLRRNLAIASATAAVVLAAGGSWLLWSRGGTREMAVAVTTTTAAPAETTTSAVVGVEEAPTVVVYFLDADTSTLVPVARDLNVLNVRPLPDLGPLIMDLLLWGPGPWDAGPLPDPVTAAEAQLTTAIPQGTELLGLTITPYGTANVELSAEFAASSPEALAQVVFTLTRIEGVTGVSFWIEGVPQAVWVEALTLVPTAAPPAGAILDDPATRLTFEGVMPPVMIESPPLGGTLETPFLITGVANPFGWQVHLTLADTNGTVLWETVVEASCSTPWSACRGDYDWSVFAATLPAGLVDYGRWGTLTANVFTQEGEPYALRQQPVWLKPDVPFTEEPEMPEATTTAVPPTTIVDGAAPWSGDPLPSDAIPMEVGDTWAAAYNKDGCAALFPVDPGSLADGAVLHDRYFGGGWGLAWDLPSGPGRWEPGGDYCTDCGREAFGVAGVGIQADGLEDSVWPNHLAWTGSAPGYGYSHAGYGYEGLALTGEAGEPLLAYLIIQGQDCLYNVWSYLGEEHLLSLIAQLRFVEGMGAG